MVDISDVLSFVQTALLTVSLVYMFTTWAFLFMANEIDLETVGSVYNCSSLATCVALHLNFGLRQDSGIGEFLMHADAIFPRIIFEDLHWLVISLTCVALFSGIIIDT